MPTLRMLLVACMESPGCHCLK
ncbi:uncharacterized protein FTOL_13947 [Fusarium torulosum]|uniref:Uncharacterized protein n=1 Tax=Fusarium torulosum TaxID=33205 RepID=A0AAE8MP50_9HYPO|nr:uncharacterized protein FTOL_13947 [Fusarium torulosum]